MEKKRNRKYHIKTGILAVLVLSICAGCSAGQGEKYTREELKKDLEGAEEQYYLTAYKYPVARFGAKEPEENHTVTLYEDTNIIKMTVAEEAIKSFSLPEEFLTFYYEMPEEEMEFFRSLAEQ